MLRIVKANPMQFTIVIDDPFLSSGEWFATKVENIGESAITAKPQTNKNDK